MVWFIGGVRSSCSSLTPCVAAVFLDRGVQPAFISAAYFMKFSRREALKLDLTKQPRYSVLFAIQRKILCL
jgi:hypothetical protein